MHRLRKKLNGNKFISSGAGLLSFLALMSLPFAWAHAQATAPAATNCCSGSSRAVTVTVPTVSPPTPIPTPAPVAGITFTQNNSGNWTYSGGFNSHLAYSTFTTSDGRGISGMTGDPFNTSVSTNVHIEVLIADTKGKPFSSGCSSAKYTGDVNTDMACVINAAQSQGFSYVIGMK